MIGLWVREKTRGEGDGDLRHLSHAHPRSGKSRALPLTPSLRVRMFSLSPAPTIFAGYVDLQRAPSGALTTFRGPMTRVAVFVDAGYLFAQGSSATTGSKKPRSVLQINETAVMAELTAVAQAKCGMQLLRVYWYDAPLNRSLTTEHIALANTDYIKLRLGFMNSRKQQKGVDSLIVTDLIELARNHAISDALLLSGDEDVRIGVQIAQSFGVRVHLLGIAAGSNSQSPQLKQEADTTSEWDSVVVAKFLSVKQFAVSTTVNANSPTATSISTNVTQSTASGQSSNSLTDQAKLEAVAQRDASALLPNDVGNLKNFWATQTGVPYDIDSKLIARGRTEIGKDLDQNEKRFIRRKFIEAVKLLP